LNKQSRKKKNLQELLKEGCIEMASEIRSVTHDFEALDREVLKYTFTD